MQSVATFSISPLLPSSERLLISAIFVPKVTCDLPTQPVYFNARWNHLKDLHLADPNYGLPSKIDILLGVDIYADVVLNGRRTGPVGTPVAFETKFGWVLTGRTDNIKISSSATSHHVATLYGDDLLRKFWEIEECPGKASNHSPEESAVVKHFHDNHRKNEDGRFVVPLPKILKQNHLVNQDHLLYADSSLSLERSLHSKDQFEEFAAVMSECMDLKHAELVPVTDLHKLSQETFYLPMHVVHKKESTTTKLRVVFDASAKSSNGVSLNDTLLVGPTT